MAVATVVATVAEAREVVPVAVTVVVAREVATVAVARVEARVEAREVEPGLEHNSKFVKNRKLRFFTKGVTGRRDSVRT